MQHAIALLKEAGSACTNCGDCNKACEVLSTRCLHIGKLSRAFAMTEGEPTKLAQILDVMPELHDANQSCFLCGHCTAHCPEHIDAQAVMRAIRVILLEAGINSTVGAESVMVDQEYHLFNVYRLVYGVHYLEYPHVEDAPEGSTTTLFFPGCPLLTYFPDHMRYATNKLLEVYPDLVITEACCGSPLESQGLDKRAHAHQEMLSHQAQHAGVTQAIFACPGCLELMKAAYQRANIDIECLSLPQVLLDAGETIGAELLEGMVAAPFDACNDKNGCFGDALRALAAEVQLVEFEKRGKDAICCGSGGAVSSNVPEFYNARTSSILHDAARLGADAILTACPTCSYAFAGECLNSGRYRGAENGNSVFLGPKTSADDLPQSISYLEALSGERLNWEQVFENLGTMWTGEYGEWVCSVLT